MGDLYHYTKEIKKIRETKEIWFSWLGDLSKSDENELIHGLNILKEFLAKESGLTKALLNRIVNMNKIYDKLLKAPHRGSYYILSCSRNPRNTYLFEHYSKNQDTILKFKDDLFGLKTNGYRLQIRYLDSLDELPPELISQAKDILYDLYKSETLKEELHSNEYNGTCDEALTIYKDFSTDILLKIFRFGLSIKTLKYKPEEETRFFVFGPQKNLNSLTFNSNDFKGIKTFLCSDLNDDEIFLESFKVENK